MVKESVMGNRLTEKEREMIKIGRDLVIIAEDLLTWCIEEDKRFLYKRCIEKHKQTILRAGAEEGI